MVVRLRTVNSGHTKVLTPTGCGLFPARCENDARVLGGRESPGVFKLSDEMNHCTEIFEDRFGDVELISASDKTDGARTRS
jgi:hypothetical protein